MDRMFDLVLSTDLFDEPDGAGNGAGRILCQPEREGQEEQRFSVGGSLHQWVQRRVDSQLQIPPDVREAGQGAVVHPQPLAMAERVTVTALDRRSA